VINAWAFLNYCGHVPAPPGLPPKVYGYARCGRQHEKRITLLKQLT